MNKLIPLLLFVVGCGTLIPTESSKLSSLQQAEKAHFDSSVGVTKQALESQPNEISVKGKDNSVTVFNPPPLPVESRLTAEGSIKSGASMVGTLSTIQSIPLGVKLILLAVGAGMVGLVGWLAWKWLSTTLIGRGIKLAAKAADVALSPAVAALEARLQQAESAEEQASIALSLNELNKARGKVTKGELK